jgi:large subunit ribosomal protein L13e
MVKHNNQVPNQHFRKDWAPWAKTWFNQPARKIARRSARLERAARVAPRPLNLLRPVIRCPTIRYNKKVRAGRGFTLEELREAGISPKEARGIGIAVDHRRKNRTEEAFQVNVNRLKMYKSKLVVFPRKNASKRIRKGDATVEQRKAIGEQIKEKSVLPINQRPARVRARAITDKEREVNVAALLRKSLTDAKLWGMREKRAKEKAAAAKSKEKKAAAADDE